MNYSTEPQSTQTTLVWQSHAWQWQFADLDDQLYHATNAQLIW